jgi:Ca2+-binding EF-hand superfamily protein
MSHPARNPSFLDVVAQYSSFPQPDPSRRDQIAASENAEEEDLEKLLDNTDPAHSHLDPEYSYSFIHLSLEECRALVQRFRSADPENNGLTQEQFSKVAGSFLASKTTSEPAAIFAMFDTTSSSRVTLREFLCGYAILCKGTTDTRIRYIFNMFDVDDEGVLRRDQLLRALKLIEAYARSAEVASKPQNNALESSVSSPTLVPGAAFDSESEDCDPDNLVDAIVDSLLAGEEQISYEEFISMCKQEENVMLWLEKLAEGTGEFIEESVRAASERHVVELNMQRAGVIGSPPQVVRGVPAGCLARRDERQRSSSRAILADGSVSFLTIDPADIDANPEAWTDRKLFASANVSAPVLVRRSKSSAETGDAVKQPFIIDFEQIKFGNIIGRGACATVYAGEWLHMPVAVKIFNEDDETRGNADVDSAHGAIIDRKLVGDLIEEASVLMQVRHPSVCLFLCLCIEPKVCIVSELYLGGSVHDYLHGANPRSFAPNKARELISHVAQGLTYVYVALWACQDLFLRFYRAD